MAYDAFKRTVCVRYTTMVCGCEFLSKKEREPKLSFSSLGKPPRPHDVEQNHTAQRRDMVHPFGALTCHRKNLPSTSGLSHRSLQRRDAESMLHNPVQVEAVPQRDETVSNSAGHCHAVATSGASRLRTTTPGQLWYSGSLLNAVVVHDADSPIQIPLRRNATMCCSGKLYQRLTIGTVPN